MPISREVLLEHNDEMINWVHSLNQLSDGKWRTEIAEGKWTIAEIISHLHAWDYYMIDSRLSIRNGEFPSPPDVDEYNSLAAEYGRNETKGKVINEFINNRNKLNELLKGFEEDDLIIPFYRNYSILEYLEGTVEHDLHHKKQILQIID